MARVTCSLPNASALISGIAFAADKDKGAMISEEISDDVALAFVAIKGYELVDVETKPATKTKPAA